MKQLTQINPIFNPGAAGVGTLDFTLWPSFSLQKLYAVINVTRNQPIYVAGAPGLGATQTPTGNPNIIALAFNTTGYASSDQLNVYYDTAPGAEANTPAERGGQLQIMQETMDQILQELKVQNIILAQGLNINIDDIESLRNDVSNVSNYPSTY